MKTTDSPESLLAALSRIGKGKILVAGDVMLDRYWYGETTRISPEAPVPVVKIGEAEERPGGTANVAVNIAELGTPCSLIALTGDDNAAQTLESKINAYGVTCCFKKVPDSRTISKLRVLSRNQQLIRLDFEDGFPHIKSDILSDVFTEELKQADVVVVSDYAKGTLKDTAAWIQKVRAENKSVVVDPKGNDFTKYKGATVVTPNLSEFETVVGVCSTDVELVEKGKRLREELALDALLITRGEKGMTLIEAGKDPLHVPTEARDVFDVTGAGDTVVAVLAAGLAAGIDMPTCVRLANCAAGVVVAKLGTAAVSRDELKQALSRRCASESVILSEEQLLLVVAAAKSRGEKIVMTNGCFDILHSGHVFYLKQARQLGDRLIVAVNDDASVCRLKGPDRPVNTLKMRMAVLAGLESTDWITSFSEDTPRRLIEKIMPDILVKGGDYKPEEIAGADAVLRSGGEVKILDFLPGCSTTKTIEGIKKRF